jgi:hypothetical protein
MHTGDETLLFILSSRSKAATYSTIVYIEKHSTSKTLGSLLL